MKKASLFFRIIITVAILIYIINTVNWNDVFSVLQSSDLGWLSLAILFSGFSLFFATIRLKYIFAVHHLYNSIQFIFSVNLIGQFFNTFLLGSNGGDLIKVYYFIKKFPKNKTISVISVFIDRIIGLITLLIVTIIFISNQYSNIQDTTDIEIIYQLLFSILSFIFLIFFFPKNIIPRKIRLLWNKTSFFQHINIVINHLKDYKAQPKLLIIIIINSFTAQLLGFLTGYCIALAIDLNINFIQLAVILSIVKCISSLPISIGGHGIREGAFIFLFGMINIIPAASNSGSIQETALVFSILLLLVSLVWSLIGGLHYLQFQNKFGIYHQI